MNANQKPAGMNSMMIMSPLISLWIGFAMPAGLCVYWIANSLFMMVQEVICGKMLKKDYEAVQREMEAAALRAKEAEKERRRQAAQRKAEALAANKGKKVKEKKNKGVDVTASREGMRTYARGRAYDPNRYPITPYVDPNPVRHTVEEDVEPEETENVVEENTTTPVIPPVVPEAVEADQDLDQDGEYEEAYAPESEEQDPKG